MGEECRYGVLGNGQGDALSSPPSTRWRNVVQKLLCYLLGGTEGGNTVQNSLLYHISPPGGRWRWEKNAVRRVLVSAPGLQKCMRVLDGAPGLRKCMRGARSSPGASKVCEGCSIEPRGLESVGGVLDRAPGPRKCVRVARSSPEASKVCEGCSIEPLGPPPAPSPPPN